MTRYRVEYMVRRPGKFGPSYGDCWSPCWPRRTYTRIATAFRIMAEHAANSTAPFIVDGVTRIVAIEDGGERQIAMQFHCGNNSGRRRLYA